MKDNADRKENVKNESKSEKNLLKILMIGPLPPPQGGARVLFKHFVEEFHKKDFIQLKVLKTWQPKKPLRKKVGRAISVFSRAWFSGRNFDVIAFWGSDRGTTYFGPMLSLVSFLTGTPWILRKFGGGFNLTYRDSNPIQRYLLRRTLLSADINLLETKTLIERFQEILPGANFAWHANGRRPDSRGKRKSGQCNKFLYLGKVKPKKGIRDILNASDHFKGSQVQVDVYGPMEGGLKEGEFQRHNGVNYGGVVTSEEVPELLRTHDALLLPTYCEGEGYPGAILEAYSYGLPVVATDWWGISEIVDDSSGILVQPRDPDELYSAMNRLVTDKNLYQRLSKGALAKSEEFSLDKWVEKFLEYCRLAASDSK